MALKFDVRKYKDDGQILVDGSDSLANKHQQVISFQNIRNKKDVYFKAFITAYNETFTPNFNSTEVFGRVDPIQQYKNTTRNITLAWKLPAASESEAYENLGRVQQLLNMLYPSYLSLDNALTLSEAPLVRLKVMNLLTSHPGNNFSEVAELFKENQSTSKLFFGYETEDDSGLGMLGVITSCNVNHNLEGSDGVFEKIAENEDGRILGAIPNTILPKLIDINISFTPLHEYTPGADNPIGPYGVRLGDTNVQKRIVEQGKTLEELREIKKTLEEKRRAAASAQQNLDRAQARARRAYRKLGSGRDLNDRDRAKLDAAVEASINNLEPQKELQSYEDEFGQFEDLI
jgi:hypothetical protein